MREAFGQVKVAPFQRDEFGSPQPRSEGEFQQVSRLIGARLKDDATPLSARPFDLALDCLRPKYEAAAQAVGLATPLGSGCRE